MERVVNNLIINLESLAKRMYNMEFVSDNYYEWKNDIEKFKKYLDNKIKEESNNRTSDSVSDK